MKSEDATKRDVHPVGSLVLVVFGLAIAALSLGYGFGTLDTPGAGFLPFFSGLAMAVFAAIPAVQTLKRGWMPLRRVWEGTKWQRGALVTAALLFFCFFLRDLGFVLATFIITTFFFRLLRKPKWRTTLLAALATTASFYVLFQVWLEAQLPRGFLGF